MKLYNKLKNKLGVIALIALLFQITMPVYQGYVYATEGENESIEVVDENKNLNQTTTKDVDTESNDEKEETEKDKVDSQEDNLSATAVEKDPNESNPKNHQDEKSFDDKNNLEKTVELKKSSIASVEKFAEVQQNLVTNFEFTIIDKQNNKTVVENDTDLKLNVENLNAVELIYHLKRPKDFELTKGDTYTLDLPDIYEGNAKDKPITVGGEKVATYDIIDRKVIITFNENVAAFDDVEMNVKISGSFKTKVFETEEEVVVEVPYSERDSYTVTLRPEKQEYEGEDKKTAGKPYIINEGGSKTTTDRNPTHIDWTVRVNDSMGSFTSATVIDDLGENLEIVADSFVVEKIIRNYKNEDIGRETVDVTPTITDKGFELNLGDIEDAYDITYTTRIIRPDGGGTKEINNNARIILGGNTNTVSDKFTGIWSGDIPTINKEGKLSDDPHIINWQVEYNYGKKDLGLVTLTDLLSHGEVDLSTVIVREVNVDIDGNIIGEGTEVSVTPVKTANGMTLENLDANGKAYYITFSSTVPVGLNGDITNTISDNLDNPNSDNASVPVNTIPTGGKVGEQGVDVNGRPYIDWTITMNSEKIDVGSITVRDVFSPEHLEFDVDNASLYELYEDGSKVNDKFTIAKYTHTDGRTGFILNVSDAGPHEYKFVYRTYYTTLGMQETELANQAELVFLDGDGKGIGDTVIVDFNLEGPKAGIEKSGRYVLNEKGDQEILWTVEINQSKISLDAGSKIIENFESGNYTYISDSLNVTANNGNVPNYTLAVDNDSKGFEITLDEKTNATLTLTFRTTVDDTNNENHVNKATIKWQGGEESAFHTVGTRVSGSNKTGEVVINEDGTKTVNWTINFNTNKNVIHGFELVDTYTPASVTVRDIKIMTGETDVTKQFDISKPSNGTFTVKNQRLDAKAYQLTYSTTLSPAEEQQEIKNTAVITYMGGSEKPEKPITSPTLGVDKKANKINKDGEKPVISWEITANTDTNNHYVNLIDAVLEDTIPEDQRLLADTIKVVREDGTVISIAEEYFTSNDNYFKISLPDGPYQYKVTFETEIIQMPSLDETDFDRYNNYTTLTNQTKNENLKQEAKDDAWIRYYADVANDLTGKTGEQNPDTENIDYEVTINPEGLTIHNAKVTDELSNHHQYVEDSIKVIKENGEVLNSGYTLTVAENNRSFTIVFDGGTISEPYKISYSTRLNANLIGSYDVKNSIVLTGGTDSTELNKTETSTRSQQWSYGGGGSGRTLEFELNKVKSNGIPLEGVEFTLERLDFDGNSIESETKTLTTDVNGLVDSGRIRAGRYILTETKVLEGYQKIEPINFSIGYSESGAEGEYTITFMDSNWETIDNNPNATAEGNILTIVNEYTDSSKIEIVASKMLEGQKLRDSQFEFELLDAEGNIIQTVTNNAQGQIIFKEITYDKVGKYSYTIREVKGTQGGITYDETEYPVTVTVVDGGEGILVSTANYDNGPAVFTNSYQAAPDSVVIEASKILEGQGLVKNQFEFELIDESGKTIQQTTNNADGQIIFDEISYEQVGSHTYIIREVVGEQGGVTYDRTQYTVVVTVDDNGNGNLVANAKYIDGPANFTNIYTPKLESVVIEASKVLEGQKLRNGQFNFELVDSNGTVLQTKENNTEGQVIFDKISYDKAGDYAYTIREVLGTQEGVRYDDTIYNVVISVTDDRKGNLTADVRYIDGLAEFINIYDAPDSEDDEGKVEGEGPGDRPGDKPGSGSGDGPSGGTAGESPQDKEDSTISDDEDRLPQTGEANNTLLYVIGTLFILVGLGIGRKKFEQ